MYWCIKHDEVKTIYCENKDQAQALANFLWNEKRRHLKDVRVINDDLVMLELKWEIVPNNVVTFVKP